MSLLVKEMKTSRICFFRSSRVAYSEISTSKDLFLVTGVCGNQAYVVLDGQLYFGEVFSGGHANGSHAVDGPHVLASVEEVDGVLHELEGVTDDHDLVQVQGELGVLLDDDVAAGLDDVLEGQLVDLLSVLQLRLGEAEDESPALGLDFLVLAADVDVDDGLEAAESLAGQDLDLSELVDLDRLQVAVHEQ